MLRYLHLIKNYERIKHTPYYSHVKVPRMLLLGFT